MRRPVAIAALLVLAACGGTGSGVIVERAVLGIDSPIPTAPSTTVAGTTTPPLQPPSGPTEEVVASEEELLASIPFVLSVSRQEDVRVSGYRAVYEGFFDGAPREVTVAVRDDSFRVEYEAEVWVYDGGVDTDTALRCVDGGCSRVAGEPPVAAMDQLLQPLAAPAIMAEAVLGAVRQGGSATITYRTDGPEPTSCAAVEQFEGSIGFDYCVGESGLVTTFSQGGDYTVELTASSPSPAAGDFTPPHPVR